MRQRGFTLLEVLIAIAIFALLAMATYRMLDSVLQTDRGQRQQEQRLRELTPGGYAGLAADLAKAI